MRKAWEKACARLAARRVTSTRYPVWSATRLEETCSTRLLPSGKNLTSLVALGYHGEILPSRFTQCLI